MKTVETLTKLDREWVYSTWENVEVSDEDIVKYVNDFSGWCDIYSVDPYANN